MIRAMIFDLDGTLVKTERLKAVSYARAVQELCPQAVSEAQVLEAFKDVVGLPRREVASELVRRFGLEETSRARMQEFGVLTAWQAFVQVRLRHYEAIMAAPQVLIENRWPHNLALLEEAKRSGCKIGLATMSYCTQVQRVLSILDLSGDFDFIASRDDVAHGKPDPEIYLLVADELDVSPRDCLVIEDSPSGVKAALSAGMWCIAVSTPFTQRALHAGELLEERWIVDEPKTLPQVLRAMLAERKTIG